MIHCGCQENKQTYLEALIGAGCASLQDLVGQNRISDILRRPSEVLNDEYICFPTEAAANVSDSSDHIVQDSNVVRHRGASGDQ